MIRAPTRVGLHDFVICDLSDVVFQIADEIVRCGRLFGKPWELRRRTSLQRRADQRMCQQNCHADLVLCRCDHFRKRRFITSIAGTTPRCFFSPVSNVPKRTTHTRRTDSAKSRNQQHGVSGNADAAPNKRPDARNSPRGLSRFYPYRIRTRATVSRTV